MSKKWTDEEIIFLENNYKLSIKELSNYMNRTEKTIRNRINKLRLFRKHWTDEEEQFLKNNYNNMSIEELAVYFNCKKERVKSKICNLGLLRPERDFICFKCNKPINDKLFGLYICKDCRNKISSIKSYKNKYGIELLEDEYFNTFDIIQWYRWTCLENTPNGKFLINIPNNLITIENISIIVKYVIEEIFHWYNREDKLQLTQPIINKYKISFSKTEGIKNSPYNLLYLAYPELNIKTWEMVHTKCNYWIDYNNFLEVVRYFYNTIPDNNLELYFNEKYLKDFLPKLNRAKESYYRSYTWQKILEDIDIYYDFKYNKAYDNTILNSNEEVLLYNYFHNILNLKNIKSIGFKRSGKYIFTNNKTKLCPDFVLDNKNILNKPLIIEYYGLFNKKRIIINSKTDVIINEYIDKTLRKNEFYKNNQDIYFIDLYPKDLKNKFEGVKNKLTSFFMEHNIDLPLVV